MRIKLFGILIIGSLCLLAASCSPAVEPPGTGTIPVVTTAPITTPDAPATIAPGQILTPTITEAPMEENLTPSPYDPAMQPLVDQAIADLAERLSISPAEIEVLSAEAVVWPDTSYGCPQPGMEYLQVPQDGARIRLGASGREYDYHSGAPQGLFLCERNPLVPKPTMPQIDIVPTPGGENN